MVQLMLTLGESSKRSFGNREDYYLVKEKNVRVKNKLCTKTRCPHSCPDWAAYPAYPVSTLLNSVRNAVRQAVRSIFNKRNREKGRGIPEGMETSKSGSEGNRAG